LRIISGTARGRRLLSPAKHTGNLPGQILIRPTADRAREALFNIIGPLVEDAAVLDLFAGTGALGLEALSRQARLAVFVDQQHQAVELIQRNVALCGFSTRARVIRRDLTKGLSFLVPYALTVNSCSRGHCKESSSAGLGEVRPDPGFSLVFIDPPYGKGLGILVLAALITAGLLAPQALAVVEDAARETLPDAVGTMRLADQRRYGDTGFWLYRFCSPAVTAG